MEHTCCFTGHRPSKLNFGYNESDSGYLALKNKLKRTIWFMVAQKGVTHFLTGGALVVDLWAAKLVIQLKAACPERGITLEAVLPCKEQSKYWKEHDQEQYREILKQCDKVTLLQDKYTSDCMDKRNLYMVLHSAYVIAVWNGSQSGTGNTVKFTREHQKKILLINPNSL